MQFDAAARREKVQSGPTSFAHVNSSLQGSRCGLEAAKLVSQVILKHRNRYRDAAPETI